MTSSVEKRTKWMRWFSLGRVFLWIIVGAIAFPLGWWASVPFVSFLSLWALVETAFAAWRADENPDVDRMVRIEEKHDRLGDQRQ